jgi:hypothetical protein
MGLNLPASSVLIHTSIHRGVWPGAKSASTVFGFHERKTVETVLRLGPVAATSLK